MIHAVEEEEAVKQVGARFEMMKNVSIFLRLFIEKRNLVRQSVNPNSKLKIR